MDATAGTAGATKSGVKVSHGDAASTLFFVALTRNRYAVAAVSGAGTCQETVAFGVVDVTVPEVTGVPPASCSCLQQAELGRLGVRPSTGRR